MYRIIAVLALVAASFAAAAQSDEASVRQAFQAKFPEMSVTGATRTPMPGLYEVIASGRIFYVDERANFVLRGSLYDLRGSVPRNLTEERNAHVQSQMATVVAQILPQSHAAAIKRVKGSGKRVVYTFEDPNCKYCRDLQRELHKLKDVTIYTFLIPILGPESVDKSRAVWCAKDRAKAWDDMMLRGVQATGKSDCEAPFEKTEQLRVRLGIGGTPAVFLATGEQVGGYLPVDKLEAALSGVR